MEKGKSKFHVIHQGRNWFVHEGDKPPVNSMQHGVRLMVAHYSSPEKGDAEAMAKKMAEANGGNYLDKR